MIKPIFLPQGQFHHECLTDYFRSLFFVPPAKHGDQELVILNMIMPGGLDGLKTYQGILKLYPQQKAIITSGFSESERVKKLLHLGAGDYVQKPYTIEKLTIAVRGEQDRETER